MCSEQTLELSCPTSEVRIQNFCNVEPKVLCGSDVY